MPDPSEPRRFFVDSSFLRARNVTITGDLATGWRASAPPPGDEVILTSAGHANTIRLDGVSANAITGVVTGERCARRSHHRGRPLPVAHPP